ncbi:MAG: hypothetical protein Q4A47_04875 [Erysipelotrichaceae bacterium]|nr:hypothetical protein [Erysipelotrichaceae bacterium]
MFKRQGKYIVILGLILLMVASFSKKYFHFNGEITILLYAVAAGLLVMGLLQSRNKL